MTSTGPAIYAEFTDHLTDTRYRVEWEVMKTMFLELLDADPGGMPPSRDRLLQTLIERGLCRDTGKEN